MLESLIIQYGYLAIFIGTLLEGESILILGGFLADRGYLQLHWVMLLALLGGMTSDHFFFYLGRKHGQNLLRRFPRWKPSVDKIHARLERVHTPLIIGFRFFYGVRALTPFVLGMSSLPANRFNFLEAIGAVIWTLSFGFGGYLFGKVLEAVLGDVKQYEITILIIIVVITLVLTLIHLIRGQRNRRMLKNKAE